MAKKEIYKMMKEHCLQGIKVIKETEKALEIKYNNQILWIPKSLCYITKNPDMFNDKENQDIYVKEWFINKLKNEDKI